MEDVTKINKINALIVDDHPIYRDGISNILKNIDIIGKCDEAENGLIALEALGKLHYEIIFMDLEMKIMDGIEASREIKKNYPDSKIIVLTMSDSRRQIVEMFEIGVCGYILKNTDASELTRAINLILEGNLYHTPEVMDTWSKFIANKALLERHNPSKSSLTEHQKRIIYYICQELTTSEIAHILSISDATVNNHRAQIMKKLNIKTGIGLVLYAVKTGIYPI